MQDTQPAQRSALSQGAKGFAPFFVSPDKGLVLTSGLLARPLDAAAELTNLHYNGIAWTSNGYGYGLHRADSFNSGAAFKEFGVHFVSDGSAKFLQQVGTKVQLYDPLDNPLTAVETNLFTATSETYPTFRSFSPAFLIYTNGVDQPQKWNGVAASFSAVTGFPLTVGSDVYTKPKFCETFQGRMVYAGFDGMPYHVLISQFDNPEGFTITGSTPSSAGIFKIPSQLGPIVSIKSAFLTTTSNEEILFVGCKKGIAIISGLDATSFRRDIMTRKIGCINNRCWLQIDDQMWLFATDGIRPFSLNTGISNLLNATATYPLLKTITARNLTASDQPFVLDNPAKQEAVWYFPQSAEVRNRRGLIMNYSTLPEFVRFSVKEYSIESSAPASWYGPACGIEYEGKVLCGGYNGKLQKHYTGKLFNDIAPRHLYRSAAMQAPTPGQEMSAKDQQIICEGQGQKFLFSVFEYTRIDGSITRRKVFSKLIESSASGQAILSQWILGFHALGGERHHRFRVSSPGHGNYFDFEISGEDPSTEIGLVGIFANFIAGGLKQA
ncbi:MAG: hypothetical protein C0469_07700 [Cyanobacteria bacterium DS2.3.42]|nr:hypothetical protein [Cyanobacteria bacterium DS2.3.42]